MTNFSIGVVSFALAILMPIVYLLGFQVRRIGAWSKRQPGPTDRIGFFILVTALFGFVVGCFIQPHWDKGEGCRDSGKSPIYCFLKI
ncbi:hypothetical protein [Herbaspirillum chlorophenolicum]|uniref:hypothetical protein n=1 Tax=Herbaspirillum chlorophenolicum TaxID=211589 RepID=UPI00067CE23E|nr:hypothetical protein [Herbaspirillum chlorophenolicum]